MVAIKQQLVSSRAVTSPGTNGRKYITVHETDNWNKYAGAQSHANLQSNGNSRAASWHWQVDDKIAIQSFPHIVRCWAAGDGKGDGNYNSIHVEICVNPDSDFKQAVKNAAALVKKIMKEENIPLSNVVQHNYWSGKNCPRYLRSGSKGVNWNQFKSMINSETSTSASNPSINYSEDYLKNIQSMLNQVGFQLGVTGKINKSTINAIQIFQRRTGLDVDGSAGPLTKAKLEEVTADKKKDEGKKEEVKQVEYKKDAQPSKSLAAKFNKAVELGITDGTYPQRPATREEVAVMIVNALGK